MPTFEQHVRSYFMGMYEIALLEGETLLFKAIKSNTLNKYLNYAADLCKHRKFYDQNTKTIKTIASPLLNSRGERSRHIKLVLDEHRRWEKMPNRREPVTKEMVEFVTNKAHLAPTPDCRYNAMADWLILGMYTGFRLSEWAQEKRSYRNNKFTKHKHGNKFATWNERGGDCSPKAFILADFEFTGANNKKLDNGSNKILKPKVVRSFNITWRLQKTKDHGQVINYRTNVNDPSMCPVLDALRIRQRVQRLNIPVDCPIVF